MQQALQGSHAADVAAGVQGIETGYLVQLAGFIQVAVVVGVVGSKAVVQLPHQGQTIGFAIQAVVAFQARAAVVQRVTLAVLVTKGCGQTACALAHFTDGRQIQVGLEATLIIVADGAFDPEGEFTDGLLGNEVHRTRSGVAPVEGALRAAQHFYPFQLGHIHAGARQLADVDSIQVHPDRWIKRQVRRITATKTTHGKAGRTPRAGCIEAVHSGQLTNQVPGIGDTALLQGVCGQCCNRQGRVLGAFHPLLGGNNHFFQAGHLGLASQARSHHQGRQGHRQGAGRRFRERHGFTLSYASMACRPYPDRLRLLSLI